MKQLSIEEKAKAYDEAIKYAHYLINEQCKEGTDGSFHRADLQKMFPKLKKESEDERIRKALIYHYQGDGCICTNEYRIDYKDIRTWLEEQGEQNPADKEEPKFKIGDKVECIESFDGFIKGHIYTCKEDGWVGCDSQGDWTSKLDKFKVIPSNGGFWEGYNAAKRELEQKSIDKVEPKFKVGDWITDNTSTFQIVRFENEWYYADDGDKNCFDVAHQYYHLWTIEDAKDGDVLAYETDEGYLWIMIYWSLYEPYEGHVHYHALLVNDEFSDKGTCCICIDNLKPATKEQRDTLMKAMADAGYIWDSKSKRLLSLKAGLSYTQNPVWSEEDKEIVEALNNYVKNLDIFFSEIKIGDKNILSKEFREKIQSWLKFLKDKYAWKPSEEQIMVLAKASETYCGIDKGVLYSLYNDLKKLKE